MTPPFKGSSLWLLALLAVATQSHAYLDPGTGSVLLQLILGGVAGLAVVGKLFWARILEFFGVRKAESPGTDNDPAE